MKYAALILAAVIPVSALAEMQRPTATYAGSTNAIGAAVTYTHAARGLLYRLSVSSATPTNNTPTNGVLVVDSDGTVILSNAAVTASGVTTNFATPLPFVGLVIKTWGADNAANTITVSPTTLR